MERTGSHNILYNYFNKATHILQLYPVNKFVVRDSLANRCCFCYDGKAFFRDAGRRPFFPNGGICLKRTMLRQTVCPVLAAFIWGTSFVAQSICADYIPPFTFNAIRCLLAAALLLAVSRIRDTILIRRGRTPFHGDRRSLLLGALFCGVFLGIASNLQQSGMADTAAGKAGFITAFYVVLVPVLGIFLKRRASLPVWIGVVLAVAGLYLLCITGDFTLEASDLYLLLCAFFFAGQIMSIDRFAEKTDSLLLSALEFLVAGVISLILALFFEHPEWSGIRHCIPQILYMALFSNCIAYTLQIISQKGSNPTVVTLLLSLESVFSVLSGAVLLHDRLTGREYLGCLLMLAAVVLAQLQAPGGGSPNTDSPAA